MPYALAVLANFSACPEKLLRSRKRFSPIFLIVYTFVSVTELIELQSIYILHPQHLLFVSNESKNLQSAFLSHLLILLRQLTLSTNVLITAHDNFRTSSSTRKARLPQISLFRLISQTGSNCIYYGGIRLENASKVAKKMSSASLRFRQASLCCFPFTSSQPWSHLPVRSKESRKMPISNLLIQPSSQYNSHMLQKPSSTSVLSRL